jgi:hypothetical protein
MTDKWQTRLLAIEGAPYGQDSNFQPKQISGHEPQRGLDTKTDSLTDHQLQSDFDFDLSTIIISSINSTVVITSSSALGESSSRQHPHLLGQQL